MKRRSFLKGLVGGAVAAPATAQHAINAAAADLSLKGGLLSSGAADIGGAIGDTSSRQWEKDRLKGLLKRSKADHEREKRRMYIETLDPNVASLRSVALHRKINMTRDAMYARSLHNEKDYLQAVIDGLIS
jgi:hypothetical protein